MMIDNWAQSRAINNKYKAMRGEIRDYLAKKPKNKDENIRYRGTLDLFYCLVRKRRFEQAREELENLIEDGFPKKFAKTLREITYRKEIAIAAGYGIHATKIETSWMVDKIIKELKSLKKSSRISTNREIARINRYWMQKPRKRSVKKGKR